MATGTSGNPVVALPGLRYNLQGYNVKAQAGESLSRTEIKSLFFLFGGHWPGVMVWTMKDWNTVWGADPWAGTPHSNVGELLLPLLLSPHISLPLSSLCCIYEQLLWVRANPFLELRSRAWR